MWCRLARLLFVPLLPALAFAASSPSRAPLTIYFDKRPPLQWLDEANTLDGLIGRRAKTVLEHARIPYLLSEANVTRQDHEIAQDRHPACALGRLKNAERLRLGQFSSVLYTSLPYVAITRRDADLPLPASLQRWADDTALRWGVQQSLYYGDYIHAQMDGAQASIVNFVQNNQHFAQLLLAGRVDFVLMHEDEAAELLRDPRMATQLHSVPLLDLQSGEQRYFYCSRSVPPEIMQRLNAALQTLKP